MTDDKALAPIPAPDLSSLRATYIPARRCGNCARFDEGCPYAEVRPIVDDGEPCDLFTWSIDLDHYHQALVSLIGGVWLYERVAGEAVQWGWEHLASSVLWNGEPIEDRNTWAAFCAELVGCTRPTIWKAWTVAGAFADVPEDTPPSLLYECASGAAQDDEQDAQGLLSLAQAHGWSAYDVRVIKRLRKAGLLDTWELPRLYVSGECIVLGVDGREAVIAQLTGYANDVRLAVEMLGAGLRVQKGRRLDNE